MTVYFELRWHIDFATEEGGWKIVIDDKTNTKSDNVTNQYSFTENWLHKNYHSQMFH